MAAIDITAGPLAEAEHRAIAPRPVRQHRRHPHRMVRFPALRHVDRADFRQALFSACCQPDHRRARSLQRVFIGFVGRPIGAAIFGHWGDRIGRKATLIVTLLVTGLSTVAVGLVPTYASIGIWGAILMTVIRICRRLDQTPLP